MEPIVVAALLLSIPPTPVFLHYLRLILSMLCAVFLLIGWGDSAIYAQSDAKNQQNRNIREPRNSRAAQVAAMMKEMQTSYQKLPWRDLPPAAQSKIKSVVSGASLFHRMPQQTIYTDPEMYHFIVRHPDLVVGFWEQLGATQLSLREVRENRFVLKEMSDTVAVVDVLYRTSDICIAYAQGEYRGPLLARSYQGEVIVVLRSRLTRDERGEPMVVCDLDAFVQINNVGADVLAKLFFASITKIADSNFEITTSFVSQVSKAAASNPNTLKAMAEEITSVHPEVCDEFCDLVDRVEARVARRNQPKPLAVRNWEMEHYFDSPQPPYTAIRYESSDELNIPKSLGSQYNVVPQLPKPAK